MFLLPGFKHGLGVATEFSIPMNFKGFLKFAYPEPLEPFLTVS